jgi:hypothetical protein
MRTLIASLLPLALLAGCAGEVEMRSVSGQTAAILNTYKGALGQFAGAQSALNAATEDRIGRLRRLREARLAEISTRADSWKLADQKHALDQLGVLGASGPDEMLANANPQLPTPGLPALKYDSGEVDAVIKPLLELKKPVTPRKRVEQLIAYGTAVRTSFEKSIAEATQSTRDAAVATSANAAEAETKAKAVTEPGG